jgi:hypothetical protein
MFEQIINYWNSLPHDVLFWIWLGSGFLFLAITAYLWYRLMRRILGHRRFRGAWFNAQEFEALVDNIIERQQETLRVLDHDELLLVRERHGGRIKPLHSAKFGGYF